MTIVDRTCTEIPGDGGGRARESVSKPLAEYRSASAYVLLGDPGAGKSTCFEQECGQIGESAVLIPARDFVTFDVHNRAEWRNKTLFIDGLDEIRAGDGDIRTALDRVRGQLDRLDRPTFRLSCREADWLGRNDRARLEAVAPEGRLKVLRLDLLTAEDAEVIAAEGQVGDAADFLAEARTRGLEGFAQNPQNLTLLMSAVAGGHWPESRRELFEVACRQLVLERNPEHRDADRERPPEELLFEAAGRACALLLLSGRVGVDLSSATSDDGTVYPPLARFDPPPAGTPPGDARALARLRRLALSSRLFAAAKADPPTGQRFEPVHRHIAEFLAGRYLGQRVDQGLPAARVIAMITAGDGGVVTPHRGLSAWLAVHSKPARTELIDRDPIGVGLYGDIGGFSNDEKESLLDALIHERRQLDDIGYRNAAVFAPLAAPALETEFLALLTAPVQSEDDQFSVKFVLRVLSRGRPMAALAAPVLKILYGAGWRQEVALAALDAFVRQRADPDARTSKLKQILADVQDGSLPDKHNELAATVLEQLYPEAIPPTEIWGHLARSHPQPTKELFVGRHCHFWTQTLDEKTPDEDVPLLLDALAAQRPDLALVDSGSGDGRAAAERLLARALAVEGDKLTPQRLYAWLNAPARTDEEFLELRTSHEVSKAASEFFLSAPPTGDDAPEAWEAASKVRFWLEAHPDVYKAALLEGICRYADEQDFQDKMVLANEYLRQAQPPPDFGLWCLEQAGEAAEAQPELARWLLGEARRRLDQGEEGLSEQLIDEAVQEHPSLRPAPPDPGASSELRERSREYKAAANTHLERRKRQEQEWLDAVRAEAPALEQNRGAPAILYELATRWLQRPYDRPRSLFDWLKGELGNEEDLAAAVAAGLCGVIEREDVPGVSQILRLHGDNLMHYLSTPFLVSLDEQDLADSRFADGLTGRQKRQACAFYFTVLSSRDAHPNWYRRLLEREVGLVAEVLLRLARAELRRGTENVPRMWDLAHDDGHAELAGLVCLPLLRGFPVRCHARQLHNLIRLLWAALQHADRRELLAVIEKKLAGKSMTVNQRVHWLAAGVIAAPDAYADRLAEFIGAKELRARQLARFLWSEHPNLFRPAELPPHALEALIRQSGAAFGVYELVDRPGNGQHNAQPESVLWRLPELIDCLAALPEPEAGAALHRLADDQTLHRWRYHLRQACDRQAAISRDSSYRRPELDQVRATLDNLSPANVADLAALALDRLDELARTIRNSDTNDWRPYWNHDTNGQPTTPNAENPCRDALLRQLRPLLPDAITLPEAPAPGSRRSDIALYCRDFKVPIEAKRQFHKALWCAARDQLVEKYTQDPATGGYGIFLVFWFGDPKKTPPDEAGTRPSSPEELQERLQTTLATQLSPDQLQKIAVRVIDVSKP